MEDDHSIRQTQKNFFEEPLVGIGVDSGDLSFPSMEKLAWAYGYPYVSARHNGELGDALEKALGAEGPVICEVFVTTDQNFEPKSAAKRLEDGTMVSPPPGRPGAVFAPGGDGPKYDHRQDLTV